MSLKPDEIFVKNCLVKSLGTSKAWEGEDPPDIYLKSGGKKKAVEITRLSPVSFSEEGLMQNRHSQDYFGLNLCDKLNIQYGKEISAEIDILLTLYVPVVNGKKYKKELTSYIREFVSKKIRVGTEKTVEIAGSKVGISIIPNRSHSKKKIVGAIVNKNSNSDILYNAQVILADRIQDKVTKCSKIKHKGAIWLALFNDFFLANHETFAQAMKSINIDHNFEKIYLIEDTGAVYQIH